MDMISQVNWNHVLIDDLDIEKQISESISIWDYLITKSNNIWQIIDVFNFKKLISLYDSGRYIKGSKAAVFCY